jgi:hypothetical protein
MDTSETLFRPEYEENIMNKVEIWVNMSEIGLSKYDISSFGKVRNSKTLVILQTHIGKEKYTQLSLYKDKEVLNRRHYIHRLLAMTFLVKQESPKPLTVDHKDRDVMNNDLNNLRWATRTEQNVNRDVYKVKSNPIFQLDIGDGHVICMWSSLGDILTNNPSYKGVTIGGACRGYSLSAYGYGWKYNKGENDYEHEEWRPHPYIKDLPVSDQGRVKNKKGFCTKGYLLHGSYVFKTGGKNYQVSRIVAETFLEQYGDHMEAYNINGDNTDNSLKNLGLRAKGQRKRKIDLNEEERPQKKKKSVK